MDPDLDVEPMTLAACASLAASYRECLPLATRAERFDLSLVVSR
jgi:hypothetical protein